MPTTTLTESLTAAGADFGEYGGARTAVSFGSPEKELAALRSEWAVFDLAWRSKLVITGEDRIRWANGMLTNNIRDLKPQHGNFSYVLNAQGRIQGDCTLFHRGDHLLLLTEAAQLSRLQPHFDKYIIMDDVELTDISEKLASLGIAGPKAEASLLAAGLLPKALESGEVVDAAWNGIGYSISRSEVPGVDGYEIWIAPENYPRIWEKLIAAGAIPAGSQALEWRRMLSGFPRTSQDIGERELPQETAQEYALHYAKGCYIGQEIVERIHSRGNVHRVFSGIEVEGALPERGTKIQLAEKVVGEVTSSAAIPVGGRKLNLALSFLRREATEPGKELKVGEVAGRVVSLPLKD